MDPRPCEDCSLCCKLLGVAELHKPAGRWCVNFSQGARCSVHYYHPAQCKGFQCYWTVVPELPDSWRPDRSRLVLWSDRDGRIIADVDGDHPEAWRAEPYYSAMKSWTDPRLEAPLEVMVRIDGRTVALFKGGAVEAGRSDPAEEDAGARGQSAALAQGRLRA